MSDDKRVDEATGTETTGHVWDGIEELNTPLPRWWLWTFYGTIVWAVIYTILYPAWPMVSGATAGVLGWSTRGEVAAEIESVALSNAEMTDSLMTVDLGVLEANEDLHRFAVSAGASVFANNCSQCHGAGAAGVQAAGYPNLLDDDWLWGGQITDIAMTVRHGIRNEVDPDARWSQMPAFGGMLENGEIAALTSHVRSLSDLEPENADGAILFADNCAACHGEDGMGNRDLGAPNLTDAIWLYGGSPEDVTYTIENARFGVMPPWGERLGEAQVRAVAAYVHGLGGGESQIGETPVETPAEDLPDDVAPGPDAGDATDPATDGPASVATPDDETIAPDAAPADAVPVDETGSDDAAADDPGTGDTGTDGAGPDAGTDPAATDATN